MKLQYKGKVKDYTASMPFLEQGPYDFSKGTCDVADNDAKILMERSPSTFSPAAEDEEHSAEDEEHSCPECEKTYKRKGDLDNHIKSQHPDILQK